MKNKFLKDQLTEEVGGKYSSKKFWGAIIMSLVCAAFILDGLKFYSANRDLFNSMLIAGCTLLGLTIAKNVFSRSEKPKDE